MLEVCIVGKGPSYRNFLDYDCQMISCNHAIEKVRRGVLVQRDAGPVFELYDCETIYAPASVLCAYAGSKAVHMPYTWDMIPKLCSAFTAIYVADLLGADKIIMVGFDNLVGRSSVYHTDFKQTGPANAWKWGLEQQIAQYDKVPARLKEKVTMV